MLGCSRAHTQQRVTGLNWIPNSISEPVPHPQALSSDQPKLDASPQPLEFSKDMSYEQLAEWLTNHPQFVGADYQRDISKLKGMYANSIIITVIVSVWLIGHLIILLCILFRCQS